MPVGFDGTGAPRVRSPAMKSAHARRMAFAVVFAAAAAACGLSVVGTGSFGGSDDGGGLDRDGARDVAAPIDDGGAGVDAPTDARDANVDDAADGSTCPAVCNGGCDAGTCILRDPTGAVTCPPGRPCVVACETTQTCGDIACGAATSCRIQCLEEQACDGITITCGAGPCTVLCGEDQGCNSVTISAAATRAFCAECRGDQGCNSTECSASPADAAACGGSSCGDVSGCGTLATVDACP